MSESSATGTTGGYPGGVPDPDSTVNIPLGPLASGTPGPSAPVSGPPVGSPPPAAARTGSSRLASAGQQARRASATLGAWTGKALAASGRVAAQAGSAMRHDPLAWIQVGGGLLAALGTLLPWLTYSALGGRVSRNGFDYGADGLAMLVLGLLIAVLALMSALRVKVPGVSVSVSARLVLTGALLLAAVLAWLEVLSTGPEEFDVSLRLIGRLDIESGAGIWLVLVGALAAFLAAASPVVVPKLQRVADR
jgi:hypothetical protein